MADHAYITVMNQRGVNYQMASDLQIEKRTMEKELEKSKTFYQVKDDLYETNHDKQVILLGFLLMAYMFTQDDGVIDEIELKKIEKMISKYFKKLDKKDIDLIVDFTNKRPDSNYCKEYINGNKINLVTFNQSVKLISKYFKGSAIYKELLIMIRKQYQ